MMKTLLSLGVLTLLLTSFTNCSPYSQSDATDESSLAGLTCTANCVTPTADNLRVTPNLSSGNQYPVANDLRDFNIAGDCNEGGFASNMITWDLVLGSQVVRSSGNMNSNTKCVNGRFEIYVLLTAGGGDGFDRTGLNSPSGRVQYTLRLTIYGQASATGGYQVGNNNSKTFTLIPQ